ncbi:related to hydrolases or acyltransferases (alpha/beta hydrolase superfamily) [Cephalotrichum gorgonifer]|uniref:Related to hydrolases or acyltransferases (Alpha/beta hydrolase superfamily) n=1 Tax=Cephalotrichum gorgonifer TaxID=2041049 RepID=A0AAE8N4S5_9PEZI|nr:related to hydrolases or acyltransferases (alpha/beta hydrolase superfamily) [Cephalotrichum gorgonifer]
MSTRTRNSLLLLLSASLAQAAPQPHIPRKEGIQWGACKHETGGLPVECATLAVPLDYTNSSSDETLDLALIKYPAQNGPSKGSIMLNFGGPGQDGLNSMIAYAPIQGPITGGDHDLVSWDPRGTGQTLRFQCFEPEELGQTYLAGLPDASDVSPGKIWAEATIVAKSCGERLKDTGDLVGMAFAARDMMQIVDALGEDGMLRYWGISGGTALGSTAAALFPDRIDKVILDGVMNVHEYYHKSGETNIVESVDATFEGFIAACFENPKKCPIASLYGSADEALSAVEKLFEKLKYEPIPVFAEGSPPFLIDYSIVNSLIYSTLYRPSDYQFLSIALAALLAGDIDALVKILGSSSGVSAIPVQAEAVMGIRCGDKIPRADKLSDLDELEEEFHAMSKWFPGFARGAYVYACAQWPFEAKERYEGDFNVKTSNPILFIGNTYDPVTPLVSAQNMSAGFEGSVVLQHNGFGHLSIVQPSNCTNEIIAQYFADGTLPKEGTVCEPNVPLFGNDEELPTGGEEPEATATQEVPAPTDDAYEETPAPTAGAE